MPNMSNAEWENAINEVANIYKQDREAAEREADPIWLKMIRAMSEQASNARARRRAKSDWAAAQIYAHLGERADYTDPLMFFPRAGEGLTKIQGRDKILKEMLANYKTKQIAEKRYPRFVEKYLLGYVPDMTPKDAADLGLFSLLGVSALPYLLTAMMGGAATQGISTNTTGRPQDPKDMFRFSGGNTIY